VVTRFKRLHPGAQKGNAANYLPLFEPHYEQNLYANPKRTAKSSFYIFDGGAPSFVQNFFMPWAFSWVFRFSKNIAEYFPRRKTHRTEALVRQGLQRIFLKLFSEK
jgi:hypothetical protein